MRKSSLQTLKKTALSVLGGTILVVGITLVLAWWPYVGVVFKGVAGAGLALTGLMILVLIKD